MASNLGSLRDISMFFSLFGLQVRPDAAETILKALMNFSFYEHKRHFLEVFLKHFQDIAAV